MRTRMQKLPRIVALSALSAVCLSMVGSGPVLADSSSAVSLAPPGEAPTEAIPGSSTLFATDDGTNAIYTINPGTGGATLFGPSGQDLSLSGLAYDTMNRVMYVSDVTTPTAWGLGTVDLSNGKVTVLGDHVNSFNIHGLAYDSINDVLYGADIECPGLATVDRSTGVSTCIGGWGTTSTIRGLGFDSQTDTLYGVDDTNLFTLDKATGVATVVGPHGAAFSGLIGLEYDTLAGVLYAASNSDSNLYTLNELTGAATLVGPTGLGLVSGLARFPARQAAFPLLEGVLLDNGDTDGTNGYSNGVDIVGFRRTLLDDFMVPTGGWTVRRFDWKHLWDSGSVGIGTGAEIAFFANDPNGGGPGIDGPGAIVEAANILSYAEMPTGRTWFSRSELHSYVMMDPVILPPGRYWVELAIAGPENNFVLVSSEFILNENWVNYADIGGLQPGFSVFGVQADLVWALSDPVGQPIMFASLGGAAVGADDAGAILRVDQHTGAGTVVGTPLPGWGLIGLGINSFGEMFAVTNNKLGNARLIEIKPSDGSLRSDRGDLMFGGQPALVQDLSFQPGTDTLFGLANGGTPATLARNELVTIDLDTAVVTSVGTDPLLMAEGFSGLAFAPDGTLWMKSPSDADLYQINPATGAVISSSLVAPLAGSIGMGFRQTDGLAFMSECCASLANDIFSLNTGTGVATLVGPIGGDRRVHDVDFSLPQPIFADGFESGDVSAWTSSKP